MPTEKQNDELCPSGKVLEAQLIAHTEAHAKATAILQKTCDKMLETVESLREYATRDWGDIENLKKSVDCKGQKIKDTQEEIQDLEVIIATHLGEHVATEKTKGRLAMGGLASGPVSIGMFEIFRYLITGRWGF